MRALNVAIVTSALVLGGCSSGPEPGATGRQGSAASSSGRQSGSSSTPSDAIRGTFDVGALELALSCVGSGSPTVVLEAGDGVPSNVMGDVVKKAFSARLRVCSYDRANTGGSDSGAALPRRSPEVVSNLHDLLAAAKVPGPYVLVGNSAGGMLVQAYAKSYPDDVSGVVAMNPVPPWDEWAKLAFPAMTATERNDWALDLRPYVSQDLLDGLLRRRRQQRDVRLPSNQQADSLDAHTRRGALPYARVHQQAVRQSR